MFVDEQNLAASVGENGGGQGTSRSPTDDRNQLGAHLAHAPGIVRYDVDFHMRGSENGIVVCSGSAWCRCYNPRPCPSVRTLELQRLRRSVPAYRRNLSGWCRSTCFAASLSLP